MVRVTRRTNPDMKSSLYIPLLSLLIAVQGLSAAASEKSRTWTSTDGRELEAQLVSVSETAVEVRRKDGRKFTLKLDAISAPPSPIPSTAPSSAPRKKQIPSNTFLRELRGKNLVIYSLSGLRARPF